jgi:hypothetical protein
MMQKDEESQVPQDNQSGKSTTSLKEQLEHILQDPQQCSELLQLYLAHVEAIPFLLLALKTKLAQQLRGSIKGEEEVETPLEKSMVSGLPLQIKLLLEATITSIELT